MPRVALITGSVGALSDALASELREAGWEVAVAPLDDPAAPPLDEVARGAEALFHVGVRTPRAAPEQERERLEAEAAFAAGRAARLAGARRFVMISTVGVYGRPRNLPCDEGELKAPRTARERARWRAEQAAWLAFRQGAPLVVLRPTLVYGPTLRGGPVRALSLVALFNQGRRRIPILRRGPVAHLVHLRDVARAAVHVAEHRDDRDVIGRAFNVGDDAPLPLAEHLAAALAAMGYAPGRILPYSPRLTGLLLALVRRIPDRILLDPLNRRLAEAWQRVVERTGVSAALAPRIDREALHWMAADHYYDTRRLGALGWHPLHPISTGGLPGTIRALMADRLLPERSPAILLEAGH